MELAIKDPISNLLDTGMKLLDKFVPNPEAKAEMAFKLQQLAAEDRRLELEAEVKLLLAQAEVSKEEAKHPSIFIAGARPYLIWVCGGGLTIEYGVYPLARLFDQTLTSGMDIPGLVALLGGMLGLSINRTFDKLKGIDTRAFEPSPKKESQSWLRNVIAKPK